MNHPDPTYFAVLVWQRRDRKYTKGCAYCLFRGQKVFEVYLCGRGETPGKKGYCQMWRSDDNRPQEAAEDPTQ